MEFCQGVCACRAEITKSPVSRCISLMCLEQLKPRIRRACTRGTAALGSKAVFCSSYCSLCVFLGLPLGRMVYYNCAAPPSIRWEDFTTQENCVLYSLNLEFSFLLSFSVQHLSEKWIHRCVLPRYPAVSLVSIELARVFTTNFW